MPVMIQIRNVPDALHRSLKLRAVSAGMSLSDYLKDELEQIASRQTLAQMAARLRSLAPVELGESVVDILDEIRSER